jgi:hypothetical protein
MANVNATPTTLEQYREAKNQYLKLKNQAKKELLARFHALAAELMQVQRELLEDFGEKVSLPLKPARPKKPSVPPQPVPAAAPAEPPAASAKKVALTRQLEKQKKKLDGLKAAGKPTRAVEDRIYELEDEIRLSQ